MKKISVVLLINLFLLNSAIADVYYCSDKIKNGIHSITGNESDYMPAQIKISQFKAKINFDEEEFSSNDLKLTSLNCQRIPGQISMTCTGVYGDIISIDATNVNSNSIKYYRASTYGRGDTLFVANGTCDKF